MTQDVRKYNYLEASKSDVWFDGLNENKMIYILRTPVWLIACKVKFASFYPEDR